MSKSPRGGTPRVLLLGTRLSLNLGVPSMALGIKQLLTEELGECAFQFAGRPLHPDLEQEAADRYGFPLIPLEDDRFSTIRTLAGVSATRLTGRPRLASKSQSIFLEAIQNADLVIGAQGIMFSDPLGQNTFRGRMFQGKNFGIARLMGKPVVQYTADFGPLENRWNRTSARFWLSNVVTATICRNAESLRWLRKIGVPEKRLLQAPDTGFLMPEDRSLAVMEFLDQCGKRPLIGVGVSHQIRNRMETTRHYDQFMGDLISHLIKRYDASVVVIPNEMHHRPQVDDHAIAVEIVKSFDGSRTAPQTVSRTASPTVSHGGSSTDLAHQSWNTSRDRSAEDSRVRLLDARSLTGPEVKGIIGAFDFLISSRYHSLVAALSQRVPSLAMGWHHKYREMFGLFGMEESVVDYREVGNPDLYQKLDVLWNQREATCEQIARHLPQVKSAIHGTAREVLSRVGLIATGSPSSRGDDEV